MYNIYKQVILVCCDLMQICNCTTI